MLGKARLSSFIFDDYWEDIGTVASFFEANLSLASDEPPFNFFEEKNPVYTQRDNSGRNHHLVCQNPREVAEWWE